VWSGRGIFQELEIGNLYPRLWRLFPVRTAGRVRV
ncbi:hypothetical protein AVDCRST_MAG92-5153, partial [uncultured Coleofasciculus sp.]